MVMPTWNNGPMCGQAIRTLYEYTEFDKYGKLLVIENSPEADPELAAMCAKYGAELYRPEENLGWMKSINLGIRRMAPVPYFTMCNDDVVFPQDRNFWSRTIELLNRDEVVGVGPISNYVMGWQFYQLPVEGEVGEVPFLIGFCATYRYNALLQVKGLDETLPGGDDLDLSIRLKEYGKLLCDRRSFLYHYGSRTGPRVHGDWDSLEAQHKTMNALIKKHGMIPWYRCVNGPWKVYRETEPSSVDLATIQRVSNAVSALGAHLQELGVFPYEGSCTMKALEFLIQETKDAAVVCEVGFNAGLSACALLEGNSRLKVVSFDIGEWPTVGPASDYLAQKYGVRHTLRLGDSRVRVPEYLRTPHTFDLTLIDGGHDFETAWADLQNLAPVSRKIMMDDTNMPGVRKAWDLAIETKLVAPMGEYADTGAIVPRYWALGLGGVR